jgi:subtilisin family serine protease
MIGSIKIFICITTLVVLYLQETNAGKDHPYVRRNVASETTKEDDNNTSTRRLSIDDIKAITSSIKPKIAINGNSKKISNILMDFINSNDGTTSSIGTGPIRLVGDSKKVLVDVVGAMNGYEQALLGIPGIDIISCYEKICSIYLPMDKIDELATYSQVVSIRASMPLTGAGKVISEGVKALGVDKAVSKYKLNATGLMIGVLSDSFNCYGGAQSDIESGDLPPLTNVKILSDLNSSECSTYYVRDEGRAMMQVIHDVAPGAKLAFHTAWRGEADFANGILQLANAGCDIIVDDVSFSQEPFFQDGIVSQAIERVVARGISYFAFAGNQDDNSWDAPNGFVGSGILEDTYVGSEVFTSEYHQFGTGSLGQPIITQQIWFPNENVVRSVVFQWDEPSFSNSVSSGVGSASDLDIYFISKDKIYASGIKYNVGVDPFEEVLINPFYMSSSNDSIVYIDIAIKLYEGPAPKYMKIICIECENISFEFESGSYSSVVGHQNTAFGVSVGAAYFNNTPAFGKSPPIIEPFSSRGGTPILFDKFGVRQTYEVRQQPLVTGPDGGLTTFFPPYGTDNRFYGTSAAAPHVAAVAALLLQAKGGRKSLSPSEISKILKSTAIDMDDPSTIDFDAGFDYKTGFGFVNASAALNKVLAKKKCYVTWNLYNSQTDALNAKLLNGTTIDEPPPCTRTNIEAVVPCGRANDQPVVIELYKNRGNKLFRKRTVSKERYFLFGNNGDNIYNGRIPPDIYTIRAIVNGKYTPKTTFTLRGDRCGY